MKRINVALMLALFAVSGMFLIARADSPVKIPEKPGKKGAGEMLKPTTHPATQPMAKILPKPRPLAKVSDEVKSQLDTIAAAYGKLKALELAGEIRMEVEEDGNKRPHQTAFSSSFAAPNRFRHQTQGRPLILGSTGKKVYGYSDTTSFYSLDDAAEERVMLHDLPEDHAKILPMQDLSLALAISKDPAAELREMATEIEKAPAQKIDGHDVDALTLLLPETKNVMTVLLDAKTHLVRRVTIDMKSGFEKMGRSDISSAIYTVDYKTIRADGDAKIGDFAWTPPTGAKDLAAARAEAMAALAADEGPAVALEGKPAPDFTLDGLDGKPITLSNLKGSVVVLDFWATWCGPCVAALPHLDKIYKDNKGAGLKVFAVNQREGKEHVAEFIKSKGWSLPVLMDVEGNVGKLYLVNGIPQTVVIGKDGVIKKVAVGFNPDGDDALRELIAKEMAAGAAAN